MQEILDFLQSLDWSPLVISIKTGIVATILSFFFGIFAARAVMKLRQYQGSTDMAWLYSGGNDYRVSTDVPQYESGI